MDGWIFLNMTFFEVFVDVLMLDLMRSSNLDLNRFSILGVTLNVNMSAFGSQQKRRVLRDTLFCGFDVRTLSIEVFLLHRLPCTDCQSDCLYFS